MKSQSFLGQCSQLTISPRIGAYRIDLGDGHNVSISSIGTLGTWHILVFQPEDGIVLKWKMNSFIPKVP